MTGHIARPSEHGSGKGETGPKGPVDVFGSNLEDLAGKLGL
jgi:2-haloacid dehalogenase